ncbi:MAG TPA: hypothetical protein VHP63_04615 [candidate division Zixibacteria bacterium]|nr:hypothetical protein [candidate division Zixibacteria bacterium]
MKKTFVATLIALLATSTAFAAKYSGDAFSLGAGARGLAMGGAVIAGPFDGTAAYWNPAGMNYLDRRNIAAMHAETFGSLLNHDYIAYIDARPKDSSTIRAFGFYFYYLGGGGIKITSLNQFNRPYVVREESHADILLAGSVSGKIKNKIDFGLTAKIIYRDIGTESGQGLTLDAGALYQVSPLLRLGLMVTDITSGFIRYSGGSTIETDSTSFETESSTESIYPTVKPAFMLEKSHRDWIGRIAASGDVKFEGLKSAAQYWVGGISMDTHLGLEVGYKNLVFGRAGSDIGRFTAGGGVDVKNITVDFAYLADDSFDATFRVSAGYRF